MLCLTSARFNMKADILRQGTPSPDGPVNPTDQDGEWVMKQDPETGEIIRVWQPADGGAGTTTPTDNVTLESIDCIARGIVDGGIRVAGTTERFGDLYENVDYVSMTVPASVRISKRDRVTNIRNRSGIILWREEEQPSSPPKRGQSPVKK